MTTHTSGPWAWVEGTDAINRRWNNLDWTVASVGNHRLGWHEDMNSEGREAEANARLIAAAPELLAALILLEREMVDSGNAGSTDYGWKPAIEKTRTAIAKATGAAA